MVKKKLIHEVWAQFVVSRRCEDEIRQFFKTEFNIPSELICNRLHLTIYHARRPMPNLVQTNSRCHFTLDTYDTRFMVMAPGGENPRPNIIPGKRKVGVRIKRTSGFRKVIDKYRNAIIEHESDAVLGTRKKSTRTQNAFGARAFQPHISLLLPYTFIENDLTVIGESFREAIPEVVFDRYIIQKTIRDKTNDRFNN